MAEIAQRVAGTDKMPRVRTRKIIDPLELSRIIGSRVYSENGDPMTAKEKDILADVPADVLESAVAAYHYDREGRELANVPASLLDLRDKAAPKDHRHGHDVTAVRAKLTAANGLAEVKNVLAEVLDILANG